MDRSRALRRLAPSRFSTTTIPGNHPGGGVGRGGARRGASQARHPQLSHRGVVKTRQSTQSNCILNPTAITKWRTYRRLCDATSKKAGAIAWENNYPENGLVKQPRRDARAISPVCSVRMFGGKAPLRLAAQKSRPHAPLAPMRMAPAYVLCK